MKEHMFWFVLTMACVVWYSTVTIYVAIRGGFDIRGMLERLSSPDGPHGPDSSKS